MKFLVTLLAALFMVSHAQQPIGLLAGLSQDGVNSVLSEVLPPLIKSLQGTSVPDLSGDTKVAVLGHVSYDVSSISVQSISYSDLAISFDDEIGIVASGLSVDVHADWHWRKDHWPHFDSSGSADGSVSGASISITGKPGRAATGGPTLDISGASCDLHDFKVKIHGSILSWLYDLLIDIFKHKIQDDLQSALEKAVTGKLNAALGKMLASFPLHETIDNKIVIDYGLAETEEYPGSDSLFLPLWGEFSTVGSKPVPVTSKTVFPTNPSTRAVDLYLAEFPFNTLGATLIATNLVQFNVTQKDIPAGSGIEIKLNTTYLKPILPALYTKYPDQAIMIEATLGKAPSLAFTTSEAVASATVATNWLVSPDNENWQSAFVVDIATALDVDLSFKSSPPKMVGQLEVPKGDPVVTLKSSSIGNFKTTTLFSLIKTLFDVLVPQANKKLEQGFPLPTIDGLSFTSPVLDFGEGFVHVGSDVTYTPPASVLHSFIDPDYVPRVYTDRQDDVDLYFKM